MPGMAGIQAIKDVKSWLTAASPTGWNPANTDNVTPKIVLETEVTDQEKKTNDHIVINYIPEISRPFGIRQGDGDWRHDVPISLQIITKKQVPPATYLDHLQKLVDEAARILKSRVRQEGYAMIILSGAHNLSKNPYGAYSVNLDITLTKINP